jgi:predicted acyltransferase
MTAAQPQPSVTRFEAIDVLRGLTLAFMIVVNMSISPSLSYAPLLHATWDGFTPTDVVFPTFLFVVGAAIWLTSQHAPTQTFSQHLRGVMTRSLWLFFWGFVVSNAPFFTLTTDNHFAWIAVGHLRIFGVLQRIALTYCVVALTVRRLSIASVMLICCGLLLGYSSLCLWGGAGTLADNLPLKLDLWLLGADHLYHGEGVPFDPEGLLSTLPALVNVYAGALCMRFLQRSFSLEIQKRMLIGYGLLLVIAALVVNLWIPINKKLWSSSYVLWTVGIDVLSMSVIMALMPLPWFKNSIACWLKPFGVNTLAIYVFAEVLMAILGTLHVNGKDIFTLLYTQLFQSWAGDKPGSLLYALAFMLLCYGLAVWMDKRKIYWRV